MPPKVSAPPPNPTLTCDCFFCASFSSLFLPISSGEIFAEITVADELSAAQKKSLEKSLGSFMSKGSKVSISYTVKPEILGGLIVDVGDKHINMSILSRIQQLQQVLNQPIAM